MKSGFLKRLLVFILVYALTLNSSIVVFAQALLEEEVNEEVLFLEDEELLQEDLPVEEVLEEIEEEDIADISEEEENLIIEGIIEEDIEDLTEETENEVAEETNEEIEESVIVIEKTEEDEEEISHRSPRRLEFFLDGLVFKLQADEGVLAHGSQLKVTELDGEAYKESIRQSQGHVMDKLRVFDISLVNEEGNQIQPNGRVSVTISGLNLGSGTKLYYLGPSQSRGLMMRGGFLSEFIEADVSGEGLSFTTDHFSIYAVGDIATGKYEFYSEGSLVDTQIVQDGQFLLEPQLPEVAGKRFKGWQQVGETSLFDFSAAVTVNSSGSFVVNALFEESFFVFFKYKGATITTKEVQAGDAVDASGVSLIVDESGKAFDHWSTSLDGPAYDFSQAVNSDLTLYAVTSDRWKVSFNSQGGSQVLPKYLVNGNTMGSLISPERVGYNFKHWNSQANGGGSVISSSTVVSSNMTAYAIWEPKTVNYSLVYWQENADDTGFTYKETVGKTGLTGSIVSVASGDISSSRYTYFSYKNHDTGVAIKGDGSTIVNVYYSRNKYTVEFVLLPSGNVTKPSSAAMVIGGNTYTHSGNKYSFIAKYDSNIANLWPTATNIADVAETSGNKTTTYQFYGWTTPGESSTFVSKRMNLTPELLNVDGTTKIFTGSWRTDLEVYKLHYMIENLSGTSGKKYGSKWYTEDMLYSQDANSVGEWSAKEIKGVTNVGKEEESGRNMYFYYDRKSYTLDFFNPGKVSTHTMKYGSSIADKGFIPTRPAGVASDYEFVDWFTTPDGTPGTEFVFTGKTMPEHNIALYAKWAPPVHSVKYFKDADNSSFDMVTNIPHGSTISEGDLVGRITPNGLSVSDFLGWYWYVDHVFVEFDFDLAIVRDDIVLHPVWDSPDYSVEYEAGEGSGTVPVDSSSYKLGSGAKILSKEGLSHPSKVFIGWMKKGTGELFYPRDRVAITESLVFVAQWGDKPQTTAIIYDGNGGMDGTESQNTFSLPNNSSHTVLASSFLREGFDFTHWNTRSDGSGVSFSPGASLVVDNKSGPNILYAQWARKNFTVSYLAETGGSIVGEANQVVFVGEDTNEVEARADEGYYFVGWDDGNEDAKRQEENVQADAVYRASFVRKTDLEVKANSVVKVYDGLALSDGGFSETGLKAGHTLEVDISGSRIDFGTAVNEVISVKVMEGSRDVSHEYTINKMDGELKITKRDLEISASSASKIFDGTALVANSYSITDGSLASGQVIESVQVVGSQTAIGSSSNIASGAHIKAGSVDVTSNYNLSYKPGLLRVWAAGLKITKSAILENPGPAAVGDKVNYSLLVTNTGEVGLVNIVVEDEMLGVNKPISSLAPGSSQTVEGSYTLTQEDINEGRLINTASVSGTHSEGGRLEDETSLETPLVQQPGLELEKTSAYTDLNGSGRVDAGDQIRYRFFVKNTGNVSLYSLKLVDSMLGLEEELSLLEPGDTWEIFYNYLLLQKDIEAGEVYNLASVKAEDPSGDKVRDEDDDEFGFDKMPDISSMKEGTYVDANGDGIVSLGDRIDYIVRVENTGNVILHNVSLVDAMIGLDELILELAPGQELDFTGSYDLVQADIDRGWVYNKVELEVDEIEDPEEPDDRTELERLPGLGIEKSASFDELSSVGDKISYTITVTNIGNVTLSQVKVKDELVGLDVLIASLAPGESQSFTRDYGIDQADLDLGFVVNTATVSGKDPEGKELADEVTIFTDLDSFPGMEAIKTAEVVDVDGDGRDSAGDRIDYRIVVRNTGNMTLHNLRVIDEMIEIDELIAELAPGEELVFEGSYHVTQEDIDSGSVLNEVELEVEEIEDPDEPSVVSDFERRSSLEVEKFADIGEASKAGDKISYLIRVTNTGNVTLTDVEVRDDLVDFSRLIPVLEVGETRVFMVDYSLKQIDLDAGRVINLVLASGKDPDGKEVTDDAELDTPLEKAPSMDVSKTGSYVDLNGDGWASVGDRIDYRISVQNTGNITLNNLHIVDALIEVDELIESLAPGELLQITGSYYFSQEDLDQGQVVNRARVGADELEEPEEPEVVTELERQPGITIEKSAELDKLVRAGDKISYQILVSNTGNVTLFDILVKDELVDLEAVIDFLEPGESRVFNREYLVLQSDIDEGHVVNKATVQAKDPDGEGLGDEAELDSPLEQLIDLGLTKKGSYVDTNGDGKVNLEDEIHYEIILENKGNVSLTEIRVIDPLLALDELIDSLAPGEVIKLEGVYKLTNTDLDRGQVLNRVSAKAREMKEPVEAKNLLELKKEKEVKKLPSTGSRTRDELFLGSMILLGLSWILIKKRKDLINR